MSPPSLPQQRHSPLSPSGDYNHISEYVPSSNHSGDDGNNGPPPPSPFYLRQQIANGNSNAFSPPYRLERSPRVGFHPQDQDYFFPLSWTCGMPKQSMSPLHPLHPPPPHLQLSQGTPQSSKTPSLQLVSVLSQGLPPDTPTLSHISATAHSPYSGSFMLSGPPCMLLGPRQQIVEAKSFYPPNDFEAPPGLPPPPLKGSRGAVSHPHPVQQTNIQSASILPHGKPDSTTPLHLPPFWLFHAFLATS
ncbi:hypothetical protein EV360DRAFT_91034 [Lentinula raphanica]|nr:hypothetical protein EV360DRAFT_91034 [Lentinula raphanica]